MKLIAPTPTTLAAARLEAQRHWDLVDGLNMRFDTALIPYNHDIDPCHVSRRLGSRVPIILTALDCALSRSFRPQHNDTYTYSDIRRCNKILLRFLLVANRHHEQHSATTLRLSYADATRISEQSG